MSRRCARTAPPNGTAGRAEAIKILASVWPDDGRHAVANALAGGLGWAADAAAVEQCVRDVAEAGHDERFEDRFVDARSLVNRLATTETFITGWPRLGELLGNDVIRRVRVTLGLVVSVETLAAAKKLP